MQPECILRYKRQARMLKGLANETRLAILNCLAESDCHVTELAGRLGISQSAISSQLAILRAQGIVTEHREGMHVNYTLNAPCALHMARCMSEACDQHRSSRPDAG